MAITTPSVYHIDPALTLLYDVNLIPSASSDFATDGSAWWLISSGTRAWNAGGWMTITAAASIPYIYKNILIANYQYKVSFRFKSADAIPALKVYGGAGVIIITPPATTSWQTFSTIITKDAGADLNLYIQANSAYTGNVDIDDITCQMVLNGDNLRPQLTSCVVSNGTSKTNVAKTAHGLVNGAVVVGTLFTNYASNYLVQYVDANNFYLCTGRAGGLINIAGTPTVNDSFVIGSQTFTYKTTRSGIGEITINSDQLTQFKNIIFAIVTDIGTTIDAVQISNSVVNTNNGYINQIYVYAKTPGTGGNSLTFTCSSTGGAMTISAGGTLTGGAYASWVAGGTTTGTFISNGGSSWTDAWQTMVSGSTATRQQAGDIIKIAKSPTPYYIGTSDWHDQDTVVPTTKTINSAASGTAGVVRFSTSQAHGFTTGDIVSVTNIGGASATYQGTWVCTVIDTTHVEIPVPFVAGVTGLITQVNRLCVKLSTARTKTITRCQLAWTGINSGTATADTGGITKDGYTSFKLVIAAGVANSTLQAYYNLPSTLNLSTYNKVTFWIYNTNAYVTTNMINICLCSGTNGTSIVNTINIPAINSVSRFIPITVDNGGALGSSIVSIAIYSGSVAASVTFYISQIHACNDLSLQSLISKNTLEQSTFTSTNYGNEGWFSIQSISEDDKLFRLDSDTNTYAATGIASRGYGYSGASESVNTYARETIKTPNASSSIVFVQYPQKSGTIGSNIIYQAGYNVSTNIQSGETFFDGSNGMGYGLICNGNVYLTFNFLNFIRYNVGLYATTSFYIIIQNISFSNNTTNGFNPTSSGNIIIQNLINSINNTLYGVYSITSHSCIINMINISNNVLTNILINRGSNNIYTLVNTQNCGVLVEFDYCGINSFIGGLFKNMSNAIQFYASSGVKVFNIITNNATTYDLVSNLGNINYLYNCNITATNEFIGSSTNKDFSQIQSINHDNTANNNWTFFNYGTINMQTATLTHAVNYEWKLALTNVARDSNYPYRYLLCRIPVNAGTQYTVTIYIKKSHATNINASLNFLSGQPCGGTNVIVNAPNDTNENLVTLQFTPTTKGVSEIELQCYIPSGGASSYILFTKTNKL